MGAWGYDIFEDDTSLDALDDLNGLEEDKLCEKLEDYLQMPILISKQEITNPYLTSGDGGSDNDNSQDLDDDRYLIDYTTCCYALASCGVIDNALNQTHSEDEDVCIISEKLAHKDAIFLSSMAIEAIDSILSSKSELYQLWEESDDFDQWKDNMEKMRSRLKNHN